MAQCANCLYHIDIFWWVIQSADVCQKSELSNYSSRVLICPKYQTSIRIILPNIPTTSWPDPIDYPQTNHMPTILATDPKHPKLIAYSNYSNYTNYSMNQKPHMFLIVPYQTLPKLIKFDLIYSRIPTICIYI